MAYFPLQQAITLLNNSPIMIASIRKWMETVKTIIAQLDDAFFENNWYKPYENSWGLFIYHLILRAPLVCLGNAIAAPLNIIATFFQSLFEQPWQKEPWKSFGGFLKEGIMVNLVDNFIAFIRNGLVGALLSPFKAIMKANLNLCICFKCSENNDPKMGDAQANSSSPSSSLAILRNEGNNYKQKPKTSRKVRFPNPIASEASLSDSSSSQPVSCKI